MSREETATAALNEMMYDENTGELWWTVSKGRRIMNRSVGSRKKDGYLHMSYQIPGKKREWFCIHQLVWFKFNGELVRMLDHKDRDKTNNRIENLRIANHKENGTNRPKQINNTSGYKGVTLHKGKYWAAQYARKWLGTFDTPEEAYAAYCKAAKEAVGEFHA